MLSAIPGNRKDRINETGTNREAQGTHDAHRLLDDAPPVRKGDDSNEARDSAQA
jgi:hypothetical protein